MRRLVGRPRRCCWCCRWPPARPTSRTRRPRTLAAGVRAPPDVRPPRAPPSPPPPPSRARPCHRPPTLRRWPNLMRADFDGRGLRVLRTEVRTDAYTRQQVTYRSNGTLVSGVLLRPTRPRPVPGGRAQPRLHRAVGLRHRPGHGARAGLAGARRASWCCTPTTAATRPATRPATSSASCGSATPATASTPCSRWRSSRTSTPTGPRWSAGRWAAASPSTPWSPRRASSTPR